ncbi:MAG: pyridoxamine kinase [Coriobacteriia bacterium]|nr:pyridoxamine kinase [Coriobacteriia bacterium]
MPETTLYQRSNNYIPRIAAVHDMCGYGNCSLTAAIPVLSAAGIDVLPVPTALFSSHTLYEDFVMLDTTDFLWNYLEMWKKIKVDLDGVYSGFLGSAQQVEIIQSLYKSYDHALRLVDPVMGDAGKMYPTYTQEMVDATKGLVKDADLLMPNLTEASLLTELEYKGQEISDDEVKVYMDALLEMGAKNVIIKGIVRDKQIINFVQSANSELQKAPHKAHDFYIHGTGDLFASSAIAAIYAGKSVLEAAQFAGNLVYEAMIETKDQPEYDMRGVSHEKSLHLLVDLLK